VLPVADGTGVDSGSSVTFAFLLVVRICLYTTSSGREVRGVSNGEICVRVLACKSLNFFSIFCTAVSCNCVCANCNFISASCFSVRSLVIASAVCAIIALMSASVIFDEVVVPVAAGFGVELGVAVELELLELAVALGVADTSGISSSWLSWSSGVGGPRGACRFDFTRSDMLACCSVI
jgi:hypothetical protein